MEGQKPQRHGLQQLLEEEVRDAAAAGVVEARAQAPPAVQEEVEVVAMDEEEGGPDQSHLDLDAISMADEAMAHAMYMEELMQMEDFGPDLVISDGDEEEPNAANVPAGGAAQSITSIHRVDDGPAGSPAVQGQQDADMHEILEVAEAELAAAVHLHIFAAAAANNNQPAAAGVADRRPLMPQRQRRERGTGRVVPPVPLLQTSRHEAFVPGNTIPALFETLLAAPALPAANGALPIPARQAVVDAASSRAVLRAVKEEEGTRAVPAPGANDALVSARQAVLATASSRDVLAAMEEEHDNGWYDSVILEAKKMEQMEEPGLLGLHDQLHYHHQQQCPASEEEEKPCYSPIRFDPDEAGPSTQSRRRPRVPLPPLADDEVPKFDCGICLETLPILDLFHGMQCGHRYCVECMATYIEGKINAGEVPIPCPDPTCREEMQEDSNGGILHPEQCKKSIDFAAFSNWGYRLAESTIPPSRRAYCPNLRCGVMLEKTGGKTPAMAFCPACGHPMCATCGWDWRRDDSGQHDCTEEPNAALLKKLAKQRRWKHCPRCKVLVEKIQGCNAMRCRCLFVFCYACGLPLGRQSGMEEGAELCRGHNRNHRV